MAQRIVELWGRRLMKPKFTARKINRFEPAQQALTIPFPQLHLLIIKTQQPISASDSFCPYLFISRSHPAS
jgi:hypothetical protein